MTRTGHKAKKLWAAQHKVEDLREEEEKQRFGIVAQNAA